MKILVVNGSPRGAEGNTQVLVDAFLSGACDAGAQADVVYLKDKKIEHCIGCFSCWIKTPGVCIHNDDMREILDMMREADIIVFATPLYVYTVTGLMKDFMDRMIPSVQPFVEIKNGLCTHPGRYPEAENKLVVLISNSGFPEQAHFSALKETFKKLFQDESHRIAGMICCGGGALLKTPDLQGGMNWYIDAVQKAGREVVEQGFISEDIQSILDRSLMEDQELFARMLNAYWASLGLEFIEAGTETKSRQTAVTTVSAERLPTPCKMDTIRDLVAGMAMTFDAKAAGNLQAIVQFVVTDEEPGKYFLEICDGSCIAYSGEHPSPTATITTPAKVWMGIARGEINGATAFMTGQYKVSGDMGLLMQFQTLFPRNIDN